jgi:hypothetical protein
MYGLGIDLHFFSLIFSFFFRSGRFWLKQLRAAATQLQESPCKDKRQKMHRLTSAACIPFSPFSEAITQVGETSAAI